MSVGIVEVGPRDGLQDLDLVVPTAEKLGLIGTLLAAGLRRIEIVSFAHPMRVPQMADAEAVVAGLADVRDVDLIGLVLNERGLRRAAACGMRSINTVVLVTDSFSMHNQGMPTAEALAMCRDVSVAARAEGMRAGVTLSAAFGCPYEGPVAPARVLELASALVEVGVDELSLADTIGIAQPAQTEELVAAVCEHVDVPIRVHLHDRGAAAGVGGVGLANAAAAVRGGAAFLDASVGGLGGCPFAPESAGNIATDALVASLADLGLDVDVDTELLAEATRLVTDLRRRAHCGDAETSPGEP